MKFLKNTGPKAEKLRSSFALKRGLYSTAITALFIVAVILLNVLFTSLSQRFPLSWDFTGDKINSISEQNAAYLQSVDKPVTIYVYATQDEIDSGYYAQAVEYYHNAQDTTDKYFSQFVVLLEEYTKHNSNIKVEYVDTTDSDKGEIVSLLAAQGASYGDLLVTSSFTVNNNPVTRYKKVAFTDLYELTDDSGYASIGYYPYTISGSKLETVLTNAIYYTTSERIIKLGVPSSHCDVKEISYLADALLAGNYELLDLSPSLLEDLPKDLDGLILAAPKADFTNAELDKFAKFLDNEGNRGKMLLYFASHTSPDLPNLEAFLAEWGIAYGDGILYETNADYASPSDATFMQIFNAATDYTQAVNSKNVLYSSGANLPMSVGFTTYGSRTTTPLLYSSPSAVIRPDGAGDSWTPDTATAKSYPTAILSADKNNLVTSYVVAFSNTSFVNNELVQNASIGNLELVVSLLNTCFDAGDSISFVSKTISNESFAEQVTQSGAQTMLVIFVFLLPLALIALGIVVWVRRRAR